MSPLSAASIRLSLTLMSAVAVLCLFLKPCCSVQMVPAQVVLNLTADDLLHNLTDDRNIGDWSEVPRGAHVSLLMQWYDNCRLPAVWHGLRHDAVVDDLKQDTSDDGKTSLITRMSTTPSASDVFFGKL